MSKVTYTLNNSDWADRLQHDLDVYVLSLFESVDMDEPPANLTGERFCGCNVCEYRETIAYLLPRIVEGLAEKKFTAERDGKQLIVTEV